MAKHVLMTVIFTATTAEQLADMMIAIGKDEDPSIKSLLTPYSDLAWVFDDTPSSTVLSRHDLGDGTHYHSLAVAHKGIDYLIHNRDLTAMKVKSVDELTDMVRLQLGQGIENEV